MVVDGLQPSVTGGVHIHSGESCESAATQGGHYFKGYPNVVKKDPWLKPFDSNRIPIAPETTGYTTNADGEAREVFFFDQKIGYDGTVGKVIVIHADVNAPVPNYQRTACGVLM